MRTTIVTAAVLAGAVFVASAVNAGTLTPVVPVSNSTSTNAIGINDVGSITGYYQTKDGLIHGFAGSLTGIYATFDWPTGRTEGLGINNDGYVVGTSNPSAGIYGDSFERTPHADLVPLTKGKKTIDGYPHAIIKHEKFIGEYWVQDKSDDVSVYGYYGKGTKYQSDLTLPFETTRTRPRGYNDKGDVVGYYRDETVGDYPGFVLKDGAVTTVRYPDPSAYYVFLEGINDRGQIVGYWENQAANDYHAFYYDPDKNAFKPIKVPGSTVSSANAVNHSGFATINSDVGSFIYCPKNCPAMKGAIDIPDAWIPAASGTGQWVICKNRCIGPSHKADRTIDAANLREAIKRDPSLNIESEER